MDETIINYNRQRHHKHRRRTLAAYSSPNLLILLLVGPVAGFELDAANNSTAAKQTALINPNLEAAIRGLNTNQTMAAAIPGDRGFGELFTIIADLNNNTTANQTSILVGEKELVLNDEEGDSFFMIGVIIANIVIFIIGLCGNAIVILVILKFTRIETVTDIYILNLALADIMFITGLAFLMTTMTIGYWIFGHLMCKIYMATTSLNQFASSLLLVVMSFDRFLAVCHPIYAQRFRRIKRAKVICLGIWVICIILMTPIFFFAKISKDMSCAIYWPEYNSINCEKAFTIYSFAIGFAVPLLLIAAFYNCVLKKLRLAASGQLGLGSSRRSRSRESANRRIEHLVIGIICTYTICWLPYWIGQLGLSFTSGNSPIPYEFFIVATCLSYTNSALNPILYAFLSDNFKRRCSDILRSICSIKLILWVRGARNRSASANGNTSATGNFLTVHNNPITTATSLCCELSEVDKIEARPLPTIDENARLVSESRIEDEKETDDFVKLCNQEEPKTRPTVYGLNSMEPINRQLIPRDDNERCKNAAFGVNTRVSLDEQASPIPRNGRHKVEQCDNNQRTKSGICQDV